MDACVAAELAVIIGCGMERLVAVCHVMPQIRGQHRYLIPFAVGQGIP